MVRRSVRPAERLGQVALHGTEADRDAGGRLQFSRGPDSRAHDLGRRLVHQVRVGHQAGHLQARRRLDLSEHGPHGG